MGRRLPDPTIETDNVVEPSPPASRRPTTLVLSVDQPVTMMPAVLGIDSVSLVAVVCTWMPRGSEYARNRPSGDSAAPVTG